MVAEPSSLLLERYQGLWHNHGAFPAALGWTSEHVQVRRFEVLAEMLKVEDHEAVLDVGCGFGDLNLYLGKFYTGLDMVPEFITEAKKRYQGRDFRTGDLLDTKLRHYPHVIASGVLGGHEVNTQMAIIEQMWRLADKSLVFNYFEPNLKAGDTPRLFGNILEMLQCEKYAIRSDYIPGDTTFRLEKGRY